MNNKDISETIKTILIIIQANTDIYYIDQKLYTPNSKVMGFNEFNQKIIIR